MQHRKAIFFCYLHASHLFTLSLFCLVAARSKRFYYIHTMLVVSFTIALFIYWFYSFLPLLLVFFSSLTFVVDVGCRINTTFSHHSNIRPFYNLQTATKEKKTSIKFTFKTSNVIKLFNAISLSAFFWFPFLLLKFNVFFFGVYIVKSVFYSSSWCWKPKEREKNGRKCLLRQTFFLHCSYLPVLFHSFRINFFVFALVSNVFHRDIAAVAAVVVASYVANKWT